MTRITSNVVWPKQIEDALVADGFVPLPEMVVAMVATVNEQLAGTGKVLDLTFGPFGRPWVRVVDKPA